MKRYLIFAAVGPLLGGFWLLLTTTVMSGYWGQSPDSAEVGKLLKVFFTTLQYSYLFGLLPALMIGAVEDILFHVKRIGPALRILLVGIIAFGAAELLYGRADRTPARSSSSCTGWSASFPAPSALAGASLCRGNAGGDGLTVA